MFASTAQKQLNKFAFVDRASTRCVRYA